MKIRELMSEEDILFDLPCSDKNEVIKALTENLAAHGHLVSAQECLEDVLKREAEISTGLVGGIAIPHTRSRAVKESRVSIGRLTDVIPWETIDGSAVQVVILITVPESCQGEHLKILAALAERLMEEGVCEELHTITEKHKIIELLEG